MIDFNQDEIQEKLREKSCFYSALFSVCVSERIFVLYEYFCSKTKASEAAPLRSILDNIWDMLESMEVDKEHLRDLLSECDSLIPHTEEISDESVSYGLDSAAAVYSALMCLQDERKHPNYASDAARFSLDSAARMIELESSSIVFTKKLQMDIQQHSVRIKELEYQFLDLDLILTGEYTSDLVTFLKERAIKNRDLFKLT